MVKTFNELFKSKLEELKAVEGLDLVQAGDLVQELDYMVESYRYETEYIRENTYVIDNRKYKEDIWKVSFKRGRKKFTLNFTQGSGWFGEDPFFINVLAALMTDYSIFNSTDGFEDFCETLGTPVKSLAEQRSARKSYSLTRKHCEKLDSMFTVEELKILSELYQDY